MVNLVSVFGAFVMQVIGHRGAAALAPENTWESFDVSIALGVDAIETDIRATADGELVLLHDRLLNRTTNGVGAIEETPWAVVQTLDAGSWFSAQYQNAKIPRLFETLERYGTQTHLVLEIKQAGIEAKVLEQVKDLNLLQNVTFTAFEFDSVRAVKGLMPEVRVGWLTSDDSPNTIAKTLAAKFEQICLPVSRLSEERVADLHGMGLEVRAWKVTDEAAMHSALKAGVDGMTIDFPHRLLTALGRSNASTDRLK
jgi:glycerophosphoryl diester phosphodiesterase